MIVLTTTGRNGSFSGVLRAIESNLVTYSPSFGLGFFEVEGEYGRRRRRRRFLRKVFRDIGRFAARAVPAAVGGLVMGGPAGAIAAAPTGFIGGKNKPLKRFFYGAAAGASIVGVSHLAQHIGVGKIPGTGGLTGKAAEAVRTAIEAKKAAPTKPPKAAIDVTPPIEPTVVPPTPSIPVKPKGMPTVYTAAEAVIPGMMTLAQKPPEPPVVTPPPEFVRPEPEYAIRKEDIHRPFIPEPPPVIKPVVYKPAIPEPPPVEPKDIARVRKEDIIKYAPYVAGGALLILLARG